MTPLSLTVRIVRTLHGVQVPGPNNFHDLLVSQILPSTGTGADWRVSLWWGRGVGEVDFSLRTGKQWGAKGKRSPWQLTPQAARAIVAAGCEELIVPRCLLDPFWWAHE